MIYSGVCREGVQPETQSDLCRKVCEMLSEDVFHHVRLLLWIALQLDGYIIFMLLLQRPLRCAPV